MCIFRGVTLFRNLSLAGVNIHLGPRMTPVSFSFVLSDSNIKQLDPEDMDEIEKIEY